VEQLLRKKKRKTMGGGAFENKIIAYTRWISHHDIKKIKKYNLTK
jgi:hypothetical protein